MAYVRNVERGDSLVLSSAEHNRIANAVNVNNAPSFVSPHESSRQYSFLMLSNGTSDTIPAFRFVEIKTTGSSTYIVPFVRNTSGETAVNRSIGYTYDNIMPGNRGMVIVSGVFNIFFCINSFGSVAYNENSGLKYAYAINSVEYVISDGTDIEDKYKGAAIVGKVIRHTDSWSDNGQYGSSTIEMLSQADSGRDNVLWGEIEDRLESGVYLVRAYDEDDNFIGHFYYAATEMAMPTNIVVGTRVILHSKMARVY